MAFSGQEKGFYSYGYSKGCGGKTISYEKGTIRKIIRKVKEKARKIGKDRNGNHLYWIEIQNYKKKYNKNFLHPIICSSESNEWKSATQEWKVIYYGEVEGAACICGKKEIKDIYKIHNKKNENELYPIGSRCIKKFKSKKMNGDIKEFKKVFNKVSNGISKLKETADKGESIRFVARLFSEELIRYLNKKGVLNNSDCQFLLGVRSKRRKNSEEQKRIDEIIEDFIVPYISGLPQNAKITIDSQMLKQ